jgi:hypothetical protein
MAGDFAGLVKPLYLALLAALTVFGVFNYYQFDKKFAAGFDDYSDLIHYYLNTKYLGELGYYDLYGAMLVADEENGGQHWQHIKKVRDLRDDTIKPAKDAINTGKKCRDDNFSKDRWREFRGDVSYFMSRVETEMLSRAFFVDHGFNPPATWSTFAEPLVSILGTEHLKYATSFDAILLLAMFVAIWWAFGLETALISSLFLLSTFSGRWPVVTHSLLRFDWLAALVIGVAMLKKEKYALGGGFMAAAALSRVFPLLFFIPICLAGALYYWDRGSMGSPYRRYFLGASWVGGIVVLLTVFLYGSATFVDSAKSVIHHGKAFSSHRVGLGCALLYRGEWSGGDVRSEGGIPRKKEIVREMQPFLWSVALGAIFLVGWYIWRCKPALWESVHLGALPLFCISNLQVNYYNFRVLFVIYHFYLWRRDPKFHLTSLGLLFLIEAAVQLAHVGGAARHAVNSLSSVGLLFYFLITACWLFMSGRGGYAIGWTQPQDPGDESKPKQTGAQQ